MESCGVTHHSALKLNKSIQLLFTKIPVSAAETDLAALAGCALKQQGIL